MTPNQIREIFEATPLNLNQVCNKNRGAVGYRIPIYQRDYRWPYPRIYRLVDDIREGCIDLESKSSKNLTFIGTIILVSDKKSKETNFDGTSLSIVDGQQRIITLLSLITLLSSKIESLKSSLLSNDQVNEWLSKEAKTTSKQLFQCIAVTDWDCVIESPFQYCPLIVREKDDFRADTSAEAYYLSPIGNFLFRNITEIAFEGKTYSPPQNPPSEEAQSIFEKRIEYIDELIEKIKNNDGKDPNEDFVFLSALDIVGSDEHRKKLKVLQEDYKDLIKPILKDKNLDYTQSSLIKLITFSRYLLDNVVMTFVEALNEQYAFDIFEALNTTGESLTAIETFKPLVIEYEETHRDTPTGFRGSNSDIYFESIEKFIRKAKKSDDQQKRSEEIVIQLALYTSGRKQSKHLSSQRKFLQDSYKSQPTAEARQKFIKYLKDVVDYRSHFWDDSPFSQIYNIGPETELCYFCLAAIRSMNTSMTIPLLTRYWTASIESGDYSTFVDAVKAVTAFLIIRRAATGGTANIDSDFRELMLKGGREKSEELIPFSTGLTEEERELPSTDILKKQFQNYLKKRPVGVSDKESWINIASQRPLKTSSTPLCRFLLLAAAHSSRPQTNKPYLLEYERLGANNEYLRREIWLGNDFESVEHVAPESGHGGVWAKDIYNDPEFRHVIGNLALLPQGANSAVGNASPEAKWFMYQALSASNHSQIESIREKAGRSGISFTKRMNEILEHQNRLPGVQGIGELKDPKDWNAALVEERSRNILSRSWETIAPWLGF